MDALLSRLGVQALNYALRSGIIITSNYAIGQCSRLLKTVDDRNARAELEDLQRLMDCKIKIVSSAISLIELKSGRGNPFLEAARPLARSLHRDIVKLGHRLEHAATAEEELRQLGSKAKAGAATGLSAELAAIIAAMKTLLARIDRDTPSLQLVISVSGESLSTSLPPGISPSRLLQSSILLTMGDTQFAQDPSRPIQIGPSFTVTLYMLFLGHSTVPSGWHRPRHDDCATGDVVAAQNGSILHESRSDDGGYGVGEGDRKPLWQEVMHKARVRLCRTPVGHVFDPIEGFVPASEAYDDGDHGYRQTWGEYAYHIEIIEDLDDGRVHDNADDITYRSYDTIPIAGIRESMPVYQISKVFYTDTGRVLNIGNAAEADSNPVLLLKRDVLAKPPRWMSNRLVPPWEDENGDMHELVGGEPDVPRLGSGHLDDDSEGELEVDRQLREDNKAVDAPWTENDRFDRTSATPGTGHQFRFPRHLDPEWIALEAFDENDDASSIGSDPHDVEPGVGEGFTAASPGTPALEDRSSLDSRLIAQIKSLSLGPEASRRPASHPPARNRPVPSVRGGSSSDNQASFVARSPFDAITTSLSLMEILIRLSSLQQFQQATHLSIPDYMLNFFLEDTSTTGLQGEESWRVRHEAKRRVGFDPYTDTPVKQRAPV